jgi:two-component system NtrC family sensor kinase
MDKSSREERPADELNEEKLRIAERMAFNIRLATLGEVTAGVAHELNNPLSVIIGFAQSAMRWPQEGQSLQTSLKAIERESLRCKRLVQDLLNFSRPLRPGKVMEDPVQITEGALSLLESQARISHIEVIRDFEDGLPMILVDKHQIQQAIINLGLNAIDAMPKGGQLTLKLARAISKTREAVVEITVADTGTGIPHDIREKIYEPFFTTKEPGKGTGLGLSLIRDIVKGHDGRLEMASELGTGTRFTIRLSADPRSRPPSASGATNLEPGPTTERSSSERSAQD